MRTVTVPTSTTAPEASACAIRIVTGRSSNEFVANTTDDSKRARSAFCGAVANFRPSGSVIAANRFGRFSCGSAS